MLAAQHGQRPVWDHLISVVKPALLAAVDDPGSKCYNLIQSTWNGSYSTWAEWCSAVGNEAGPHYWWAVRDCNAARKSFRLSLRGPRGPNGALCGMRGSLERLALHTLPELRRLQLSDMPGLTGTVPVSFSALTKLEELDMSNNQLTGALPPSFSALTNLNTLSLRGNGLTGTLPEAYSRLSVLMELDISDNSFTGTLPESWSWLTMFLNKLDLSGNGIMGPLPTNYSYLNMLWELDMSNNQLTGALPVSYSRLMYLNTLNLTNNNLTGTLPAPWSTLQSLTYLRLDNNPGLTGPVPESWSVIIQEKLAAVEEVFDLRKTGLCMPNSAPQPMKGLLLENTLPTCPPGPKDNGELSTGAIVGIAVGVGGASIIAAGALVYVLRARRKREQQLDSKLGERTTELTHGQEL